MAHVLSSGEKTNLRKPKQWGKYYLAVPEYHVKYSAELGAPPASNDYVVSVPYVSGVGTTSDVLADMTLYVGTTAGAYDLGMCRIRKPIADSTIFIGETSEIDWAHGGTIYLTVVDDYSLWARKSRRIGSELFTDWDVEYDDQNEDYEPVVVMGGHRVARLSGASVSVLLGASDDTDTWVIGSTVASRSWSISGATLDNAALKNPTATFTAAGTYLAYCTVTAANSKTATGVVYVIIYDDAHPLITDFIVSDGSYEINAGGSYNVTLYNPTAQTSIRKRSLVILCAEDYAESAVNELPAAIAGAGNIIASGYANDISISTNGETKQLSFTVYSPAYWLDQCGSYPIVLNDSYTGTLLRWEDFVNLDVRQSMYFVLRWLSTASRIMDITIVNDTRKILTAELDAETLWSALSGIAKNIFANVTIDQYGRMFVEIEPQMEFDGSRNYPVVMTLEKRDLKSALSWTLRDTNSVSTLYMSTIKNETGGTSTTMYSMATGHAHANTGSVESLDGTLVDDQSDSNALCARYYGWRNVQPYNFSAQLVHPLRAASCAPRQFYSITIAPSDDPRGIGFSGNVIPRGVGFAINSETGVFEVSVDFEFEAVSGLAVNGDIPNMEEINFSNGDFSTVDDFPPMEFDDFELDPAQENLNHPVEVALCTSTHGLAFTRNFNESDPSKIVWQAMNNGLSSFERQTVSDFVVTPNGKMFITCERYSSVAASLKIYWANGIGGAWNLYYDAAANGNLYVTGLTVNPMKSEEIIFHTTDALATATNKIHFGNSAGYTSHDLAPQDPDGGGEAFYLRDYRTGICISEAKIYLFGSRRGGIGNIPVPIAQRISMGGATEAAWYPTSAFGSDGTARMVLAAGGIMYYWSSGFGGYTKITDPGVTETFDSSVPRSGGFEQAFSISPDGTHIMSLGDTYVAKLSTDSGASWSSTPSGIIGATVWENCRDNGRWVFGGGSTVRFTADQGSTFFEKSGNLSFVMPLANLTHLRFIR